MENNLKKIKVIILSDGTGTTASEMVRAALAQFSNIDVYFTRFKNVRTKEKILTIVEQASVNHDLIVYTLVSNELRKHLKEACYERGIKAVDLLEDLLTSISDILNKAPLRSPGLLHSVDEQYYRKIEALEYSLEHDDGKKIKKMEHADIILLGISRTSKTPLSIFLSLHGYKVINIPLVKDHPLPENLSQIDQSKIFCLTIDPDTLYKIRRKRLYSMGMNNRQANYGDISAIIDEIEWANSFFKKNKRWPIINITDKALEETASEIIRLIQMRKNNSLKHKKNLKK